MKKYKYYILSFIIPLILLLTVLILNHVLDGKFSIFSSDLYGQYSKLLAHFQNLLNGDANIFYSFSKGLGGGMISTYAYYLISPFNFLLLLFSNNNIYIATIIMILLKISLCGTTMYTYLKYHFKNKDVYLLLFSIFYALSLYNIANYFQIMWLDIVILSPLVLLGIDKLVLEKKSLLYGITLFLCILLNYYLGYMVCVFSIIYFIYRLLLNKIDKKIIIKFIIVSLISGMMTMFINIPNIIATLSEVRSTKTYMGIINTDISGILSKLFIGSHSGENILNANHPLLYCGILVFVLLFLYFLNKKITKKEKLLSFGVLFIMIISIFISPINYAWHLFSPPNCFNYRYIFLFIIFIIYLSCKSLFNLKHLTKQDYLIIGPIIPIIGTFIIINNSLPLYLIYITVFFYLIYLLLLYNIKTKGAKLLLVLLVLVEIYFNLHIIFVNYDFLYNKYVFGRYNEKIESINMINDDSLFYRTEFLSYEGFNEKASYNDSFLYDYNGSSIWLSTLNRDNYFFYKLGYLVGMNRYRYQSYPISDALLGIKYYEDDFENNLYEIIYTHDVSSLDDIFYGFSYKNNYLHQNPYALSLGYMINGFNNLDKLNGFENQDIMINEMTNLNLPVYVKENIDKYYKIVNNCDLNLLINIETFSDKYSYSIYINGEIYKTLTEEDSNVVKIPNKYSINEQIKIEVIPNSNVTIKNLTMYTFNKDNFIKHIDYLKKHQLNITEFKDGYVLGNINVEDDTILFTSIPYEKGWNIYVDGVKTEYYSIYDTFIGLDLSSGNHELEFTYEAPGFKLGVIVSLISLTTFILYEIKEHKRKL